MSIYKVGDTWYIYLVRSGQRIRRSAGTKEKKLAQQLHDQLAADLWRQSELGETPAYTWNDALKAWLKEGERGDPDKLRIAAFGRTLGNPTLKSITPINIDRALEGKTPSNKARYLGIIIAILNLAHAKGMLDKVPRLAKPKQMKERVRWLTKAEWEALLKKLNDRHKQMARFAIATGLRRHNVTHLEWSQVDMKRKVAWIHPDQTKAGDAIGVPLSTEAMAVLRERKGKHDQWVFDYHGKPAERIFTKAFKDALMAAGIENFRWHDLRHTWASWHTMNGTRLEELQQLGGWKTLQMVQRYAHLSPEHLAGVANNAKPVKMGHIHAIPSAKNKA